MGNHINIKDGKLVLSFRFDPAVVVAVRAIDGRHWNVKEKQWELPMENAKEAIAALAPFGFVPSAAVITLKKKDEEFAKEIDMIRSATDAPYAGKLPLYDFQRKGAHFLKAMPSALLADVPGLGKTIQTMAAVEEDGHVLVFCPASLKYSWEAEILKWQPKSKVIVLYGNKDQRATQWSFAKDVKYVIANYELLFHDFELIKDVFWSTIVADEATRISNPQAKTTQNLKLLNCQKRIALTGTPISNSPDDIFSIMDWIVPRYLGTFIQFKKKYCTVEEGYNYAAGRYYEQIIGYKNLDQLREKVSRFMLRRTKEEVFDDFPKKTIEDIVFALPETERRMYNAIKEQVIEDIRKLGDLDTRTLGIVPVKMLRLKQCTGHTKLVGGYGSGESTKLATLKEMLKPIMQSGEKAIIFTQFVEMLYLMRDALSEFNPILIYGDVDAPERMLRIKEFNDDPNPRIIIMTEAGAYGFNMQSASYVFHYDAPWSIAKLQQREDRAHRIGQTKAVTVYNLIAKDTIDEYVMKTLHKKQKVSANILEDAERMEQAGLSKDDIAEILRL